jgi:hypothetical protein
MLYRISEQMFNRFLLPNKVIIPRIYLIIPLLFNETDTMASIIYLFSDSSSHCHRRPRYVVLFVRFILSRTYLMKLTPLFLYCFYSRFLYRTDDNFLGKCNNGAIIIGSFGGSGVQLLSFCYPGPQWTLATFVIFFFGGILGLAGTKLQYKQS